MWQKLIRKIVSKPTPSRVLAFYLAEIGQVTRRMTETLRKACHMTKHVPHCQGKHFSTSQARRTHMTSMTHPSVEIQTSPLAVPALPHWFGEVSLVAQYLTHLGVLEALSQRVRLARGRTGTSDVIDFV